MSKKQREKVEDEVRFHRAQMRAQSDSAPDSSVYDTQTPSSSDQLHHGYNGYVNGAVDRIRKHPAKALAVDSRKTYVISRFLRVNLR